jgi:urease accessory protein
MTIIMTTSIAMTDGAPGGYALLRLMAWMSPGFPVGGFTYSHGLEWHVETALVHDRASLDGWVRDVLELGAGRGDGILLARAWRAVMAGDADALLETSALALALSSSAERALETEAQGTAFLRALSSGWPALAADIAKLHPAVRAGDAVAYPIAVGMAGAAAGIALEQVLSAFLHGFAAQLVSAAVKLIPLGQSDGLVVLGGLEDALLTATSVALMADPEDLGGFMPRVDLANLHHETQYTRLFRS